MKRHDDFDCANALRWIADEICVRSVLLTQPHPSGSTTAAERLDGYEVETDEVTIIYSGNESIPVTGFTDVVADDEQRVSCYVELIAIGRRGEELADGEARYSVKLADD